MKILPNRRFIWDIMSLPLIIAAIMICEAAGQKGTSDIAISQANVTFARVMSGPIWNDSDCTHGVNWIDYNGDGYLDLYFPHWFYDIAHINTLYSNDGNGDFAKVVSGSVASDVHAIDASWADFDNDGDIDGFACSPPTTAGLRPNYMYVNNGDGSFIKLTSGSVATDSGMSVSATWGDFDNDGDVDLLVGNHCPPPCSDGIGPFYYRNDIDSLARIDRQLIGLPNGDFAYHSVCDFDYDGDLDIVYRRNELSNVVYRNNGDGTFTNDNTIAFAADFSIGFSWADYDNDGDFDLLETGENDCRLYKNTGGTFDRVPSEEFNPGASTWLSGAWGDYDNDGDLDVVITSFAGYFEPRANALMENNGDGTFTKVNTGPVATDMEPSLGAAWADYDRDGDLDLVIVNANYYHNALYQNGGNDNGWLDVICRGAISNRSGIGAKLKIVATIAGQVVRQLREITSQSNLFSQAPLEAHFGLGDATIVDSILIEWPSGYRDTLLNIEINQLLIIIEGYSHDFDGDGIPGRDDNCPLNYNPNQEDTDADLVGDSCDNCIDKYNPDQTDLNGNNIGDACDYMCGDANNDEAVNVSDAVWIINYVFVDGGPPEPYESGDANCDDAVNISDAVWIISYVFIGGHEPCDTNGNGEADC